MICDKCGTALPTKAMACPHCHVLLTPAQREIQKQILEENKKYSKPEYKSEKYGVKRDMLFRDDDNTNLKYLMVFSGALVGALLIVILLFV